MYNICIARVGDGLIYGLLDVTYDGHFGVVGCSGVIVMMGYPHVLLVVTLYANVL